MGRFRATKNVLTVSTFHLLSRPEKLQRLKKELVEAILEQENILSWKELEMLRYLVSSASPKDDLLENFQIQDLVRCYQGGIAVSVYVDDSGMISDIFPDSLTGYPTDYLEFRRLA